MKIKTLLIIFTHKKGEGAEKRLLFSQQLSITSRSSGSPNILKASAVAL
jgi:hypothetical protein